MIKGEQKVAISKATRCRTKAKAKAEAGLRAIYHVLKIPGFRHLGNAKKGGFLGKTR